ncbi:MAG: helix-turn-helix domain-containing protein [Candidatus Binataceae bacterium]
MITSPTSFLSEILEGIGGKEIPPHQLAYFRVRLRNRIHDLVVSEFGRRQKVKKATKMDLARRIGREPAQITRWLSAPSNWTLDTISDLMIAMGTEPALGVESLAERVVRDSKRRRNPKRKLSVVKALRTHRPAA